MAEHSAMTAPIFYYIFQGNRNITVALVKNAEDRSKTVKLYRQNRKLLHYSEVNPSESGNIHVSVSAPDQPEVEIHKPNWEVSLSRIYQMKSENFLVKGSSQECVLKFQINDEEHDLSVKFTEMAKTKSVPSGMEFSDYSGINRKRRMQQNDEFGGKIPRTEGHLDVHVEGTIQNLQIACEGSSKQPRRTQSESSKEAIKESREKQDSGDDC